MYALQTLRLTDNPAYHAGVDSKAWAGQSLSGPAPFICPVTGLEMNGRYRFSMLLQCGCVISERALHEVPPSSEGGAGAGGACLSCGTPYGTDDVITLNGTDEVGCCLALVSWA